MDLDETTVETTENVEAADALPEDMIEEQEPADESLDSFTDGEGQATEESAEEPEQPERKASEPGWIKKRVNDAVEKAVARTRAEMQAMFDQQMAPIREKMMEDEAQELVRSRKVSDIETARELVRLRQGAAVPPAGTPTAKGNPQPRNAQGQFAPKEDPEVTTRISMLRHQADRIKGNGGPDVIAEFQNNEEIKQKVISGEMDFYDVADYLKQKPSRRKPPSPMRSPNGASGQNNPNAIDLMSDEQFRRMEQRIEKGARIRLS